MTKAELIAANYATIKAVTDDPVVHRAYLEGVVSTLLHEAAFTSDAQEMVDQLGDKIEILQDRLVDVEVAVHPTEDSKRREFLQALLPQILEIAKVWLAQSAEAPDLGVEPKPPAGFVHCAICGDAFNPTMHNALCPHAYDWEPKTWNCAGCGEKNIDVQTHRCASAPETPEAP